MQFTVSLFTKPVGKKQQWNQEPYDNLLDKVPGAVVVENPRFPVVVCEITAESWDQARREILTIAKESGLQVMRITCDNASEDIAMNP